MPTTVVLPPAFDAEYFAACLLNEPFNLSVEQLAKLTDRQIFDLYFYPRDEKTGALKSPVYTLPGESKEITREEEKALFFGIGRSIGMREEDLVSQWTAKYGSD